MTKKIKKTKAETPVIVEETAAPESITEEPQLPPGHVTVTVDIDLLKTMRPHICIPCYGGMVTESTMTSLVKWAQTAFQYGISWTLETIVNESLINRARNTLVAKFLTDQTESTHLMFIDADIGFEPWHILALLNRNVDVIGGIYPMKTLPLRNVLNCDAGMEEGPDGLQEVSKTGTGFMLIKRDVFHKMNSHPAVKSFQNDIGLDPKYDANMKTYFDTAIRQHRLYSEDWCFCENWRDMGGKIWVDKRILLRHTGTYVFCVENEQHIAQQYGQGFLNAQIQQGIVQMVEQPTIAEEPIPEPVTTEVPTEDSPSSATE